MSKLLIIGGSSGIGSQILQEQATKRACINFSRQAPTTKEIEHYAVDVLHDKLPAIQDIGTIIYCPGSINLKPIASLKDEDFRDDFEINVMGAVKVIRQYHRQLKRVDHASILLFSTVAVQQGMAFHASVAAAKGAVEGLAKSLASEFAPKIRVNVIAPTVTDTPLAANLLRSNEMRQKMSDRHPLKRIVHSSEVATLADFLISPAAAGITGQVIPIDCGITTIR